MAPLDKDIQNSKVAWAVVAYIIPVASIFITIGVLWGTLRSSVCVNTENIAALAAAMKTMDTVNRSRDMDSTSIRKDVEYLVKAVDEIQISLRQHTNEGQKP